jgi:hypothetical protein
MSLEQQYESADALEKAKAEEIRRACAQFIAATPDFWPTPENERIMFEAICSPENDYLKPTRAADWKEVFAQVRDRLAEKPISRRQPARSSLTRAEINSWSAKELQRQIESNPRREAEINAVLSRG